MSHGLLLSTEFGHQLVIKMFPESGLKLRLGWPRYGAKVYFWNV